MADEIQARIVSVNTSPGGVPKRNVERARVGLRGLDGDGHDSPSHGGTRAAVCIYTLEAIRRVAADGHEAFPGAYGENLTLEGLEMDTLEPGDRLEIGADGAVLELTQFVTPCTTIARFFVGGDFGRILSTRHPEDARWYASVVREGEVAVGDAIRVVAASDGAVAR